MSRSRHLVLELFDYHNISINRHVFSRCFARFGFEAGDVPLMQHNDRVWRISACEQQGTVWVARVLAMQPTDNVLLCFSAFIIIRYAALFSWCPAVSQYKGNSKSLNHYNAAVDELCIALCCSLSLHECITVFASHVCHGGVTLILNPIRGEWANHVRYWSDILRLCISFCFSPMLAECAAALR